MLKSFKIFLARRRIARWERRRGVLAFLGTWLPIWCVLAAAFVFMRVFGYMLLLVIPVWVIGRYFIAHRRAEVVLEKIYSIVRLNHPLADSLRAAGDSDQGSVGVRLQMLAELLQRGLMLAESLQLALPELRPNDLATIMEAERCGRLLPELARITARKQAWRAATELDAGYAFYFLATLGVFLLATAGFVFLISPKDQRMLHSFQLPYKESVLAPLLSKIPAILLLATTVIVVTVTIAAAGAILRRLAIPFFRRGNVSIYIRDAVAWRLPILGSLIRCRSWLDGTRILAQGVLAGQPLPDIAQSAATAVGSRVARRRLRLWREKMLAGMSADNAARKCGLPRMLCSALAQPLGSTGSALTLVAGYYDLKFRRRLELIRAISIPIAVLCMGTLVLLLCLAVYLPYIQILQAVSGGGGS
ncbi:MAG: type II secretion system F family protein [Phycisphaerae bacterium]